MAQPRGRGAAEQALAEQFNRAAKEVRAQSALVASEAVLPRSAAPSYNKPSPPRWSKRSPPPGPLPGRLRGSCACECRAHGGADRVTELSGLLNQVALPTQGRSAVVKKTKRYELGQSTCREKARPCSAAGMRAPRRTVPCGISQARDQHRFAARSRGALLAGGAGRVRVAVEERPALQACRRGSRTPASSLTTATATTLCKRT